MRSQRKRAHRSPFVFFFLPLISTLLGGSHKIPRKHSLNAQEVDGFRRNRGGKSWSLRVTSGFVESLDSRRLPRMFLWRLRDTWRLLTSSFRPLSALLLRETKWTRERTINYGCFWRDRSRLLAFLNETRCHWQVERGYFRYRVAFRVAEIRWLCSA